MKFRLHIEMDNAAFDEPDIEVARLLQKVVDKIWQYGVIPTSYTNILDINGNTVGAYRLREED